MATTLTMMQPRSWTYIALGRVSGLPAESVLMAGPLAAIAASWVTERFVNRRSPLAAPTLPRSRVALGLRVMMVLAIAWGVAFVLPAAALLGYWAGRATGGQAYVVELGLALLRFEFFVLSGALIGVLIARWTAPLAALAWSMLWVLVAPIAYTVGLPHRRSLLEYFIFPAVSATDHRQLGSAVGVVGIWWVAVLAAFVVVALGWFAALADHRPQLLGAGVAALAILGFLGMMMPTILPGPFIDDDTPRPLACVVSARLEICSTQEQSAVLDDIAAPIEEALARVGTHLPDDIVAVATDGAVPALLAEGHQQDQIITLSLGTSGLGDPAFAVGASLAGLDACGPSPADRESAGWAFAFASWLAPESIYATPPYGNPLSGFDDETVLTWYSENAEALRSCSYTGAGPP